MGRTKAVSPVVKVRGDSGGSAPPPAPTRVRKSLALKTLVNAAD